MTWSASRILQRSASSQWSVGHRVVDWPEISNPDTTQVDFTGQALAYATRNGGFLAKGRYYARMIGSDEAPAIQAKVAALRAAFLAALPGESLPWAYELFVGGLGSTSLVRLDLDGERVTGEERLLTDLQPKPERIRDVAQGPEGAIYLVTDAARGRVLRLVPEH